MVDYLLFRKTFEESTTMMLLHRIKKQFGKENNNNKEIKVNKWSRFKKRKKNEESPYQGHMYSESCLNDTLNVYWILLSPINDLNPNFLFFSNFDRNDFHWEWKNTRAYTKPSPTKEKDKSLQRKRPNYTKKNL